MWRSQIPRSKANQKAVEVEADDWETDPDFVVSFSNYYFILSGNVCV